MSNCPNHPIAISRDEFLYIGFSLEKHRLQKLFVGSHGFLLQNYVFYCKSGINGYKTFRAIILFL